MAPEASDLLREPLVRRIRQRLTRAVGSMMNSALGRSENPGYAEDIVAEALAAAYEKRQRYDPRSGALYPWLLRIARNRTLDFLRRHRELSRELALDDSTTSPSSHPLHEPAHDVDDAASPSPEIFALRRALERLRHYDREILIGRIGSALNYDELERHFDFAVRKSTLRVHVGRARKRLRRELAKEAIFLGLLGPRDPEGSLASEPPP